MIDAYRTLYTRLCNNPSLYNALFAKLKNMESSQVFPDSLPPRPAHQADLWSSVYVLYALSWRFGSCIQSEPKRCTIWLQRFWSPLHNLKGWNIDISKFKTAVLEKGFHVYTSRKYFQIYWNFIVDVLRWTSLISQYFGSILTSFYRMISFVLCYFLKSQKVCHRKLLEGVAGKFWKT